MIRTRLALRSWRGPRDGRRTRLAVASVAAAGAYFVALPPLEHVLGVEGARVFVLIPIVVAAWSFGLQWGLVSGAVILILTGLHTWGTGGAALPAGAIERVAGTMAISGLVGWLGDLSRSALVSQRMYSALIENGPAVTYTWSQKRGLIFISSNAEALAGYSKREWEADFNGVVQRMLEPPDRTILGAAFESLQLHGRPMRATFRMRRRDGRLIWVDHNADCIDSSRSDTTIQGTLVDVTARHEVADALELSHVARAESEAKSEFIAATSHELRTPLSSILGFAELLAGGQTPLDERQARYVANIRSAGEHLLAVISDLLDLSKVAAGRVELTYEYINVLGAVRNAVAQVTPLSDQKGLAMRVIGDGDLTIRADRRRLHQILLNLLSNAVKFTDRGEIKISSDLEDGAAAIRVSDSGLGIPAKSLASVFDEFVQLGAPERSQGGTGLGLPLSRRLARVMGGDITVASRLGRGSTFTLSLPIRDPDPKSIASSAEQPS